MRSPRPTTPIRFVEAGWRLYPVGKRAGRSRSDDVLAVSLAAGKTVADAAKDAGVSEGTVYARLKKPEFEERVKELRRQAVAAAVGRLSATMTKAADVLEKLLDSKDEHVQHKAAVKIIELGTKIIDVEELSERLQELEATVQAMGKR
jgi:hypothetical protein